MNFKGLRLTAALGAALLLTACGGSDDAAETSPASIEAAATQSSVAGNAPVEAAAGDGVSIVDGWIKATEGTEETSMTAVFGVLTNASTEDRTIVAATTTASPRAELHEMATVDGAMVMREVAGGIAIPAGESVELKPGGLHVMIMDATTEIAPGDQISVTLTLDDDSTLEFVALAKEYAGANEEYESDGGMDMGGMDHGTMDHGTSEMDHSGHDMSETSSS